MRVDAVADDARDRVVVMRMIMRVMRMAVMMRNKLVFAQVASQQKNRPQPNDHQTGDQGKPRDKAVPARCIAQRKVSRRRVDRHPLYGKL